jgi:protein TonB
MAMALTSNAIRIPAACLLGWLVTGTMFMLLWRMVDSPVDVGERVEAKRIEFTRMRKDTDVATKRLEKVERQRPVVAPEVPRIALSVGQADNPVPVVAPPTGTGYALSKLTLGAGSDQDVMPLVRINPNYPSRALSSNIEGWALVQFAVTATGAVRDPIVVDSEPPGIFDAAALKAVARWRYNPKVEGGVAVERVGVQTTIRFVIED